MGAPSTPSIPAPPPAATPPTLANAATSSASGGPSRAAAAAAAATQGGTVGDMGAQGAAMAPLTTKSTALGGGQLQPGQ